MLKYYAYDINSELQVTFPDEKGNSMLIYIEDTEFEMSYDDVVTLVKSLNDHLERIDFEIKLGTKD